MNRRQFLGTASAAAALPASANPVDKPALLGGTPLKLTGARQWPVFDQTEEKALLGVLKSGHWYRGSGQMVRKFEEQYAALTGAKHCLAVANGTSALLASISALGIDAGDEVILPPYTFVATLNVILEKHALPIFVDSDRATFQMDAAKLNAAITDRTKLILPVHMGGAPVDLDSILATAKKRNVPVIEDACQAHLGEWRNRKVGTWGIAGCFSFQASKNLNSGEGGAVLFNDASFHEATRAFHSNQTNSQSLNLRLTEFQAGLLMAQMTRIEAQSKTREQNAAYLTKLLSEVKGIAPAKLYPGCTRNAWHLYMFRYDKQHFAGMPREKFLKALAAEGVPASGGYNPLNKQPLIARIFATRGFRRLFTDAELKRWAERNHCPENDKLCEEAVWLTQPMLLGPRTDMEVIATAIGKIQRHAASL
ncbi:MAG: DegT/DnrJ/EryC1/StrS family aminotransferase [Bryobacterales bacterium]|nr:DegT/DnrJ/EryC1/StrS family aminotransferase [Bryobacterales bacterium]